MQKNISNSLTFEGTPEQIEDIFAFLKSKTDDEQLLDFNNITPMPIWVYGSSPDVKDIDSKDCEKYGSENTAPGWAIDHWGVKWPAEGAWRSGNCMHFRTSGGSPIQLIEKLAWLFPDVTITLFFFDIANVETNCVIVYKDTEMSKKVSEFDEDKGEWIVVGEEA